MKAVLLSIQPKWCELIASGKKTVEVRKTKPKIDVPFKVYIYCTSGKPYWLFNERFESEEKANGKVIGEFVCDKVDEYRYGVYDNEFVYHIPTAEGIKTCMEYTEAEEYGNGKPLYFWHISNLVIYDKPKELHHFFKPCGTCDKKGTRRCTEESTPCRAKVITRPPQSWCYVEGVN